MCASADKRVHALIQQITDQEDKGAQGCSSSGGCSLCPRPREELFSVSHVQSRFSWSKFIKSSFANEAQQR